MRWPRLRQESVCWHPAEARIIYTPAHHAFGRNTVYNLDLNHDGSVDFFLSNDYRNQSGGTGADMRVNAPRGNGFAVSATQGFALALRKGANINGKRLFDSGFGLMGVVSTSTGGNVRYRGNWLHATNRYLGLKFSVAGKTHYGWARLTVRGTSDPAHFTAILTGYAYETIPNKPIVAGKTKGPDEISFKEPDAGVTMPTRKPASLGLLAMGATGLSAWRREEAVGTTR